MITKKRKKNIRDPEGTKADILAVAQQEFANKGLHGARIDTISARTKTTKRGIYYYFGGKSQLYAAVIERAYVELMQSEANLLIGDSDPREALKRIAEFIFDFFDDHPDFIRLLITENIHEARYVKKSKLLKSMPSTIVQKIAEVLRRGQEGGVFRPDVDPLDLVQLINSVCFYRMSNQYTFLQLYKRDFSSSDGKAKDRQMLCESVLRFAGSQPHML